MSEVGVELKAHTVKTIVYQKNHISMYRSKEKKDEVDECKCVKILGVDDDGFNLYALSTILM